MRVPRSVTCIGNTAAAIEDVTELQALPSRYGGCMSFVPPVQRLFASCPVMATRRSKKRVLRMRSNINLSFSTYIKTLKT